MTHRDPNDERLTRLLEGAGPGSIPALEPDPHLPTRVRALARENVTLQVVERTHPWPRWLRTSLGAAAVALALAAGGYLGYSAGASYAASAISVAGETSSTPDSDVLWDALAQSGFADDLQQLTPADEVAK
ncbi:MAG TPA: hypothetical protein VFX92_03055 [Candidatus Krumholzibacteria bacterium]|nr:hypothetical protein [Candidatus Krumholzibacteria bacterium]